MPTILKKASEETDAVRQLQHVVALLAFGTNNIMTTKQPINPILGETLNGWIGDTKVAIEQITHHPPVSAYFFEGPGFICHGTFEAKPSIGLPHVHFMIYGETHIIFKQTGNRYVFTNPFMRVKGVISGNRKFIIEGF